MGFFKPARISGKEAFWTLVISCIIAIPTMFLFKNNEPWVSFALNGGLFFFLSMGNGFITNSITISWIEAPTKRFLVTLLLMVLYTLFIAAFVASSVAYGFYGHLPPQSLRVIGTGYFLTVLAITFFIGLFQFGRSFLLNWRDSAIQAAQLREAHIAAQYESLQNQVNPHFLFNSLNVLSTLVYKDQDLAAKFIKQLSKVYRYVLDVKNKEVVPIDMELKALEAYVFLIKIRFDKGVVFQNGLPKGLNGHIAPLSLQMLVENAVKHNSAYEEQPLVISILEEDGYIVVKNNLQKKSNQQEVMGIGLANIKTRYQFLSDHPVLIEEKETHFIVKVPIIKVEAPEVVLA